MPLSREDPKGLGIVLVESSWKASRRPYHKQKLALIMANLRHFALELQAEGWRVDYVDFDAAENRQHFAGELERAVRRLAPEALTMVRPGEWRVDRLVEGAARAADLPLERVEDPRFSCSPAEFADWAEAGEVVFWIALYEPIPDPPGASINWLFALDLDGDTSTGRLPGTRSINPDLGDEAVVQISYELGTGSYTDVLYIWDPGAGNWEELAGALRFEIDRSRTLIAMAVDLQALSDAVEQTSGVTLDAAKATGRAAAQAVSQRVIDFSPDLPE